MSNEFKLITYKKPKKYSYNASKNLSQNNNRPENEDKVWAQIQQAKDELQHSDFFKSVKALLRESASILNHPTITRIICLGLGKVTEFLTSRYQLAFLLCLQDCYPENTLKVDLFDPQFSASDRELLVSQSYCNFNVLSDNIEGKYQVHSHDTTIFYMPHCPKQLTNNLLWANWSCFKLNRCIVIANSFNTIVEKTPKRSLSVNGQYICNIVPHIVELGVVNSFRFYEIFNDTSIHIFPFDRLRMLPEDFWTMNCDQAPEYVEEDVEFIRLGDSLH